MWKLSDAGERNRTYKGLPVKKNTFVGETWYNKRRDMEMTAVITNGMLFRSVQTGACHLHFAYEAITTEFALSRQCWV
jgi:hypothetical protein